MASGAGWARRVRAAMGVRDAFAGYRRPDAPMASYAVLIALFASLLGSFAWRAGRSGRLPARVGAGDLALLGVATHKATRLLAKDKVTSVVRAPFAEFEEEGDGSEVNERPRGRGLRLAVGELLTCPFCLGPWVASALATGLVVAPRVARFGAAILAAAAISDALHWADEGLRRVAKGESGR